MTNDAIDGMFSHPHDPDDDCEDKPKCDRNDTARSASTALVPRSDLQQRYTKTESSIAARAESRQPALATAAATIAAVTSEEDGLAPIDFAACYFISVVTREMTQNPPLQETEDLCFCCRDGGELVECDFKSGGTYQDSLGVSCPKVYHEACLGYKVPEAFVWTCPRHRCRKIISRAVSRGSVLRPGSS
uniref:Zinc finger PHD-type domain-containing protein n=1 Tax=Globisporangium ultimum (strain ATCC 200006 / CBS 805.95 / DAOM BR144) TaxID=431595 RepID=K3WN28_GLOUD